jgi:GntR family transcriptional regulator
VTCPCPAPPSPDRNRWRPIAGELRAQIRSGAYAPGDRLPSNAALQARHGVSGQTVQHAVNSLRTEGLIETRPGRGWFVRRPPEVVRLPRRPEPGWRPPADVPRGCDLEEDGRVLDVVTELRFDAAAAGVAAQLRVAPGTEILVRERTMSDGDDVVALATSYFPRSITRGTVIETADTGPGGVFACLLRLGHEVVRHVEQVTAGVARDDEARRFGRPDPPVVVRLVRVTAGRTSVLGAIHIVVLADRFELCYELPVAP